MSSSRPVARRRLALVFALCAVASLASLASPARGESDVLEPGGTVVWEGRFDRLAVLTPESSLTCSAGLCETFSLTVALGEGYWDATPGAVEVTAMMVDPVTGGAFYDGETDIDLFVSDDAGNEIARSAAVDSNAESVFLRGLADGDYVVAVALANAQQPPVAFRALAQVEHDPTLGPGETPRELLPNLTALPPTNVNIATAAGIVPQPRNPLVSCYPDETIEDPGHPTRCLRFNQIIANTGEGKLELRFNVAQGVTATEESAQRIVQRIYRNDGTYRDRVADRYEFHATHAHIHYTGFGQSFLYPCTWSAGVPSCDTVWEAAGRKVGFCVIDVMLLSQWFGAPGNGPRNHTYPTCNVPTQDEWMVQGIDVGWADVYGWNLPDQYIDITSTPDGLYRLEQVANPKAEVAEPFAVLESNTADNRASSYICIAGTDASIVTSQTQADACLDRG